MPGRRRPQNRHTSAFALVMRLHEGQRMAPLVLRDIRIVVSRPVPGAILAPIGGYQPFRTAASLRPQHDSPKGLGATAALARIRAERLSREANHDVPQPPKPPDRPAPTDVGPDRALAPLCQPE